MTPNPTPAGWYPDTVAGQIRYWDGEHWTVHTAPAGPPLPPPTSFDALRETPTPSLVLPPVAARAALPQIGVGALVGAAVALAGSFLPWVSVISAFGSIDVGGFDAGDGKITAGAALAAGLLGYLGLTTRDNRQVLAALVAALVGLGVAIYDFVNVGSKVSSVNSEYARASVGYGLYACLAGFAICAGCLVVARKDAALR